ncbi:MAG: hypothetical protein M3680_06365 [Myxococcota bacterium]|nr:hypothetical protein [Myxococcota bacterium]
MKNTNRIYACLIAATVSATACVADDSEPVDTEDETLSTTSQALTSYITGTWTVGQGPQALANGTDYFCFLSKVHGAFYGGGEWVEVYRAADNHWYVTGGSMQRALKATATCVNYTAFSNVAKGYIAQSIPLVSNSTYNVAPISDMTWLSAMQGEFRGGGEYLSVYATPGTWTARANAMSGSGVRGRALAARLQTANFATRNANYFGPISQMAPKDGRTFNNADVDLGSSSDRVCYLTHLGGNFTGYGEWAEVKVENGRWWLRTEADRFNSGVNATAQCVSLF